MGILKPEGEEPFYLPTVQKVQVLGGNPVTLSFTVSFNGGPLQKTRVELTNDKAVTLLGELKRVLTS
jgi:hypothetical protein